MSSGCKDNISTSPLHSVAWKKYIILAMLLLLFPGCSTKPYVIPPAPAPVEHPPQTTAIVVVPEVVHPAPPTKGPAHSLYSSAKVAIDSKNYDLAELHLERALRIESRNPLYWYTMAEVKFEKQLYTDTINFCLKSKSLAGRDFNLHQKNDRLIERAKRQLP